VTAARAAQAQIGLVDQGRRLQCLARLLAREPVRRQTAQLVIDQRQELVPGVRIALREGVQEVGDIAHDC
jgi:hypothetical protein